MQTMYDNKLPVVSLNVAPSGQKAKHSKKSRIPVIRVNVPKNDVVLLEKKKNKNQKRGGQHVVPRPFRRQSGSRTDSQLAMEYARTLVAPELGPISNRPDSAPYRDLVVSPSFPVPFQSVTDASLSYEVAGLCVLPSLFAQYYTVSASSNGALTWSSSSNNPQLSSLESNFSFYTPISLAVRSYQTDALQYQGGTWYVAQFAEGNPSTFLPGHISDIADSPYTAQLDGADVADGGARNSWLPPNSTTSFYQQPLGTQIVASGALVFIWIGSPNGNGSGSTHATFNSSVHFNVEVLADESVAYLFPSKPSVGGNDSVLGNALRTALSWIDGIGKTVKGFDDFMSAMSWDSVSERLTRSLRTGNSYLGMNHSGRLLMRREDNFDRFCRQLRAFLKQTDLDLLSTALSELKDSSVPSLKLLVDALNDPQTFEKEFDRKMNSTGTPLVVLEPDSLSSDILTDDRRLAVPPLLRQSRVRFSAGGPKVI